MQTAVAPPEPGEAVVACCRSGRGTERLASARPRELPAGAPSLASAATPESEAPGGEVTGEHDHSLRHQGSRGGLCLPTGSRRTTGWPTTSTSHHLPPAPCPANLCIKEKTGHAPPLLRKQTPFSSMLTTFRENGHTHTWSNSVFPQVHVLPEAQNVTLFAIGVITEALG